MICIYCQQEYTTSPTTEYEELCKHISACLQHPLTKALNDKELLIKALMGLISIQSQEDIPPFVSYLKSLPPSEDVAKTLFALEALDKVF